MNLTKNNLTIRNAMAGDAPQLCAWWNDGKTMAHAGFPNGIGTTAEKIQASLATDADDTHRRHVIELDGNPIGEMNYRNMGNAIAEIGIKICVETQREKGVGTTSLSMFIDALFMYYGFDKIILDTNVKNTRAQHVYENKLGFAKVRVNENAWRDQVGQMQSSIDYELYKKDWRKPEGYIHIRNERTADHFAVESITRDAFWQYDNLKEICDEHLLVHRLRNADSFIPELNLVAEVNGQIAGHIIYTVSKVIDESCTPHEVLTFGPLTVAPAYQRKGVGTALMRHSFKIAKELGYSRIIIYGHPRYYPRVGFVEASQYGITTNTGDNGDWFMAYSLQENAFDGVTGQHHVDPIYADLADEDVLEFDKKFPPRNSLSILLERAKIYKYSSLTYIDASDLQNSKVLHNNDNLILLHDESKSPAMLYFATNDFNLVVAEVAKIEKSFKIGFVPREFVPALENLNLTKWCEYADFFNNDLPKISIANPAQPEFATPEECPIVAEISKQVNHNEPIEELQKWQTENKIILQREGTNIVGFCCVAIYNEGTTLWVQEIAIAPAYQGKGHGTILLEQAINYGIQNGAVKGFLHVDVHNKKAISLYKKYGFVGEYSNTEIQMVRGLQV